MNTIKSTTLLAALAAALALLLSACGGGGEAAPAPEDSDAGQTVSAETVDGVGDVLVDAAGAALYAADQEADGSIVCIASCATIWEPLTLAGSEAPTGGTGLSGRLDVVRRPDGARQVTFEGRPLYRFALDPEPGIVTGNGLADSFDGRTFSWHVATPEGVSTSDANSPSDPPGYDLAG